jgi:hypothetical protein
MANDWPGAIPFVHVRRLGVRRSPLGTILVSFMGGVGKPHHHRCDRHRAQLIHLYLEANAGALPRQIAPRIIRDFFSKSDQMYAVNGGGAAHSRVYFSPNFFARLVQELQLVLTIPGPWGVAMFRIGGIALGGLAFLAVFQFALFRMQTPVV